MKIAILTKEYPPNIYGGAGVHVDYLSRELAELEEKKHDVKILCFGKQKESNQNTEVLGINTACKVPFQDSRHQKLMDTLLNNVIMSGSLNDANIIHCHTWYTHFAGCLLKQLLKVPLVLTTHSLEPHRPWKAEQLGSAYQASTWLEKVAYENADGVIAVSEAMKQDVHSLYGISLNKIRVIHNGINLDQYKPTSHPELLTSYQIDPNKPFILFVGRITRQKGIIHLVKALQYIEPGIQIVLCAGAPDTEEIGQEMAERVKKARTQSVNEIIWIPKIVPKEDIISLYTHASLFICPSIYEPFGIINLEAMACGTPVIASAIGGIPEVVVHDETGLLVPFEPIDPYNFEPKYPEQFAQDLALAINSLLASPDKIDNMGKKSRERVEKFFSWTKIAHQTVEFYQELLE